MQYLTRLFVVFFTMLLIVGCESKDFLSSGMPESSDLTEDGIVLAKTNHENDGCGCGRIVARLSSSGSR